MRSVPDQIAPFISRDWSSLGTDGFGMSDTRPALRRHFHVDAASVVVRVLERLAAVGEMDPGAPGLARKRYHLVHDGPAH
jgi:pyruvate dehydrogenase E1 component